MAEGKSLFSYLRKNENESVYTMQCGARVIVDQTKQNIPAAICVFSPGAKEQNEFH